MLKTLLSLVLIAVVIIGTFIFTVLWSVENPLDAVEIYVDIKGNDLVNDISDLTSAISDSITTVIETR